MIEKSLDKIVVADVHALVTDGIPESKTIEYKLTLPRATDGDRKEFLADICSFANAAGGDVLYGVAESGGVANAAPGLAGVNEDQERLRLESIIRDGIAPRIQGVQIRIVAGFEQGPVVIVRVPRSWSGPHMVTFKGSSRFLSRNSAGKFPMDVTEIRTAFEASGLVSERLTRWRDERLGRIVANEGPIRLASEGCLVFHLVPLESLSHPWRFPTSVLENYMGGLQPLGANGWGHRTNLDGFMTYTADRGGQGAAVSYIQCFRSGCIEVVTTEVIDVDQGTKRISAVYREKDIVHTTDSCFKALQQIGIQSPIAFLLSITGAKGAILPTETLRPRHDRYPIDRDILVFPDVLIETFDADLPSVLKPAFDAVWNASGLPGSRNYDSAGKWIPQR